MKLNWFSPVPPERTDVANYTARLASELMLQFDVTFWTSGEYSPDGLPPGAQLRRFKTGEVSGDDRRAILGGLCVFNIGNDARFHADIFQLGQRQPGICILHDTRIHHFVFERSRHDMPAWAGYMSTARRLYGKAGEDSARAIVESHGALIDEHAEEMPFLEAVTENALGVICHSQQATAEVRRRSAVPTLTLPLPFPCPALSDPDTRRWAPPWQFVIFGFLNPNRRLESILRALVHLREEIDFRLSVVGALWDQGLIERLVVELGLSDRVVLRGFVSDAELDAEIAGAHLAFNLRHPTMGEASGALLRAWAHATPVMVTDAGWYAQLSDALAVKVSVEHEVEDIVRTVRSLAADGTRLCDMGRNGRMRLAADHSPQAYAKDFANALQDLGLLSRRAAAQVMLARAAERGGPELLLERATEVISNLFDADCTR